MNQLQEGEKHDFEEYYKNAAQIEKEATPTITEHMPQSRIVVEKDIPGSGGKSWLWILLGVALVAGGVAALAGSSDSGGGSSGSTDSQTPTGDVTVGW